MCCVKCDMFSLFQDTLSQQSVDIQDSVQPRPSDRRQFQPIVGSLASEEVGKNKSTASKCFLTLKPYSLRREVWHNRISWIDAWTTIPQARLMPWSTLADVTELWPAVPGIVFQELWRCHLSCEICSSSSSSRKGWRYKACNLYKISLCNILDLIISIKIIMVFHPGWLHNLISLHWPIKQV